MGLVAFGAELLGEQKQQLTAAVALAGIEYGTEESVEQTAEDFEASGFNFEHRAAAVELVDAQELHFLQISSAAEFFDQGLVVGAA